MNLNNFLHIFEFNKHSSLPSCFYTYCDFC